MSLTYAIPDLHGRRDLLDAAIAAIERHAAGAPATLVTLGDYVDRGPQSRQVIDRLKSFASPTIKLVTLKGNHEAMMWEACHGLAELAWWERNGGSTTLASYGPLSDPSDPAVVPPDHLRWLAGLPLLHVDPHRVYVHAAVDPDVPLQQQREQTLLWKRYPDGFSKGHGERHVVHGHHADPKAPIVSRGKTNLDALAWKTGRLIVGVFDDARPGGAVDYLDIRGEPAGGDQA
jgi:serine/threonine protein phosphatase 1